MDDSHPNSTTIPSDPTLTTEPPSSTPDKPSRPLPPTSTLQKLRYLLLRRLASAAHSTDHTLLRLAKLLSSPSGADRLLCTISYTLTLTHALLSRLLARKLSNIASQIAEKADGVLLPGETLIATLPAPTTTKLIAQAVGSSKALAATIADYRIFVRLWGCMGLYTWARGTYLAPLPAGASGREKLLRGVTWAEIASCVAFQVLENGAYLSSKGVLTSSGWAGEAGKAREVKWWVWSSRFWAAYVGLELARLGLETFHSNGEGVVDDGEKEDKLRKEEMKAKNWLWWKDLASNIAYAPMTLHWSVEEGVLSDWGVGGCGIVAGGALLLESWKETA
ncbi:hypothetical protein P153DRAFT_369161 [Dothidotthia symphoricarpi CBS 119687]|uniref:Peroxin 11C n=1 Tax=Dothidotthia symphoricarpi CBS 119687 TaxID=1392245 RepID=A0A6A6A5S9_9PLEO|nr:uncharacterized protein P153DRAFT_369161 [Dothidotthia symphoricarpi CBS 119687]KAF2126444.1 hypothetical protein P153DRAFT_369161 [Dothidotthia symphoricarpi CBS 119687]